MAVDTQTPPGSDPMSSFWNDWFSRMGMASAPQQAAPQANWSADAIKQMQRTFFDAMAKYCEEYMRSEQFLGLMKQSLDRSLAFKKQLDEFLAQAARGMQIPARADVNDIAGTLRGIEDRLFKRLDAIEERLDAVEGNRGDREAKEPRKRK